MIAEVYKNIYKIEVPLEKSPLKVLNAYLIKGDKRHLLIDTGFNTEEAKHTLFSAFDDMGLSVEETDVFLTHVHADHSGLAGALKNEHNKVYCSKKDGDYMNSLVTLDYDAYLHRYYEMFGIPNIKRMKGGEISLKKYLGDVPVDYTELNPGGSLTVGEYRFDVIDLSGHTPGQIGLYDKDHAILFSGDHILADITPNIVMWDHDDMDSIQVFVDNLKKVRNMPVNHVFSSHRRIMENHRERIDEMIFHHENRLNEVLDILGPRVMTAFEVSERMRWELMDGHFANFPPEQIWFATSEAHAHLEHLCRKGLLSQHLEGSRKVYTEKDGSGSFRYILS